MTVYSVTSKYYDNGKTNAVLHSYEVDTMPEHKERYFPHYDLYVDYFTDKKRAEEFYDSVCQA